MFHVIIDSKITFTTLGNILFGPSPDGCQSAPKPIENNSKIDQEHSDSRLKCYVIDFGLARRHIDSCGNVFPARKRSEFRGTRNYASLDSHENRDLSRKDDLWSLFMVLADMSLGGLPWRLAQNFKKNI